MSDFAFNNYCIHCDKLCPTNSVYCSEECKMIEYQSSLDSATTNANTTGTTSSLTSSTTSSASSVRLSNPSTSDLSQTSSELVSPLLTPALYLQQQQQLHLGPGSSPFMQTHLVDVEGNDDYSDLNYFDLNYSVRSNINYTQTTNNSSDKNEKSTSDLLNSTSHNYRKWLTAL
ncbi:hypothetical protein KGF56_001376 [Candida oxycetoniae]|uniref:Uncharacterized protein n=1 Tax=Candida oxycetoniae TaxID=497107 RepID=A0AAI9WZ75_9ASCO|nr:uncharacterized protein KGF56_001376 [Candida oxycetoniae]KAI3405769.2 hypothetical protein KGF56_001376 [Candida oxycetoniae]